MIAALEAEARAGVGRAAVATVVGALAAAMAAEAPEAEARAGVGRAAVVAMVMAVQAAMERALENHNRIAHCIVWHFHPEGNM